MNFARRSGMYVILILFGYLSEVTIIPYIRLGGVSPNMLYVVIGIVTVAYGKLRAFWAGMIYGLLVQIMLPSDPFLDLGLYSLTTLFVSFAFADKPLKTIEYERAMNRERREIPAWARTLGCTMLNTFLYEAVRMTYIYLGGSRLDGGHFLRAALSVVGTGLLCALIMFPARRLIFGKKTEQTVIRPAPVTFEKR